MNSTPSGPEAAPEWRRTLLAFARPPCLAGLLGDKDRLPAKNLQAYYFLVGEAGSQQLGSTSVKLLVMGVRPVPSSRRTAIPSTTIREQCVHDGCVAFASVEATVSFVLSRLIW